MQDSDNFSSASEQQDLFTEGEFVSYTEASTAQRFVNYLTDMLLMRFGISYITSDLLLRFLMAVSPRTASTLFSEESYLVAGYVIAALNHLLYYTFCEKAFRGYTLGKFVSGTRVIREDGDELTLKDAFLRSLCRLVPFEAFSIWFGNGPWHDVWTKTKVIQTR